MGGFDKINNDPNDDIVLANEVAITNLPVSVLSIINRAMALLEEKDEAMFKVQENPSEENTREYEEAVRAYRLYLSKMYVSSFTP